MHPRYRSHRCISAIVSLCLPISASLVHIKEYKDFTMSFFLNNDSSKPVFTDCSYLLNLPRIKKRARNLMKVLLFKMMRTASLMSLWKLLPKTTVKVLLLSHLFACLLLKAYPEHFASLQLWHPFYSGCGVYCFLKQSVRLQLMVGICDSSLFT